MIRAAGILYLTPDGQALFVRRGAGGDHPNEWALPGGKIEEGETEEQAARREAREECGKPPAGKLTPLMRSLLPADLSPDNTEPGEDVEFTTFVQRVERPWVPELNYEHTGYVWCKLSEAPLPLHLGVALAIERVAADEVGVARMIQAGRLPSPQRYDNFWLFAIRITGTGESYRPALGEVVWRRPEVYLNQAFCERCAGLPVIWDHPEKKPKLDTVEYGRRTIGSVMFAWVRGDEVWSIARVYDEPAAKAMSDPKKRLSTSPGVVFGPDSGNRKITLEDGTPVLIEGKPALLDHIAVCEAGVWDKGGDPAGIATQEVVEPSPLPPADPQPLTAEMAVADSAGARTMAEKPEDEAREDKARKDAEKPAGDERQDAASRLDAAVDRVLAHLDSAEKRMDALCGRMDEAERKDAARRDSEKPADERNDGGRKDNEKEPEKGAAEQTAADSRKDVEKPADESREDSRLDSATVRRMIDEAVAGAVRPYQERLQQVEAQSHRQLTDAELDQLSAVQARADSVYGAFGQRAPRPMPGEAAMAYRRRVAGGLKQHSGRLKEVDLAAVSADPKAFEVFEEMVYNDALLAAKDPAYMVGEGGGLREIKTPDSAGRQISTFIGDPADWMGQFTGRRSRVTGSPAARITH